MLILKKGELKLTKSQFKHLTSLINAEIIDVLAQAGSIKGFLDEAEKADLKDSLQETIGSLKGYCQPELTVYEAKKIRDYYKTLLRNIVKKIGFLKKAGYLSRIRNIK